MSSRKPAGLEQRLELHVAGRGSLSADDEARVCTFLANVASRSRWHRLANPGEIPFFPCCSSILFHPRFTTEGCDEGRTDDEVVRFLNAVPITEQEWLLAKNSIDALLDHWPDYQIDLFTDRFARGPDA